MAINWAERLDNIKNNVKTDMENTSTNRWAAILDQSRANQKFQGLQIKLSDFENSKSGFEKSANSFTSGWQDEKSTNNFYSSFGNFYAEAEAIRQDLEENAAAYKSILGDEKYKTIYDSFNTVSKNKDSGLEGFKRRGDLYSKYKTADEYNIAVKNQGYADKYKNYTYQQIDKFLNSDNYKTMRRRGIIDESEALWLKNQKYALATAKEVESELKNKKALFAGNRTNENLDFNFNQPKKVFKEADLTQLLDETKVKNEEWAKSKGYKNYAEYLREYQDFEGEIEVLETVLAQKKKQENFNEKWGDVNVEGGYTPKINKNETDNLYGQVNNIVPDGWIKEKDTKTKAKYVRDRAVTDADYIAEMSPQEKAKYNKIYDTQGIKKANEYYEDLVSLSLDKRVNEKEFQKAYNFTSSGGLNAVIGNIASVGDSLSSGVEFVANNLMGETDKRVVSATRSQGFREGTKTHWDGAWGEDVWDFLYDTGMSGVDSAAAAGLSAVVPYLGEVLLGGSAAASTYNDALDRGISHGDAILSSVAAGVAESLFEHVSIGNLSSLKPSSFAGLGFTKAGIKKAATEIGKQMLVNATEETLTEIANVVSDQLINGELSSYAIAVKDYYMQGMTPEEAKKKAAEDVGKQVLLAGASGLLMGFGFGTGGSIVGLSSSQIKNSKNGNTIISNGNVETLKILAVDSDIKNIVKDAEKLTEKSKPSEVGSVYNRLVENAVESSVKEMTPVLLENGAKESGSNSAKGWATQIAGSIFEGNQSKIANLQYNKVTSGVYDAFTKEGKYGGDKLLVLKELATPVKVKNTTEGNSVGDMGGKTVVNEQGVEVPATADGQPAAGPVATSGIKGIAAAPRSGEIRTITEAYKQGVAENLEKQRPNPKAMSEKQFMKTYFADKVQISPEEEEVLKDFGKANGLEVEFVDGAVNGKGYGVFQNGKQIVISRYAKKPMAALFKHEFTHSIEKAKGYAKFQKYVLEESKAFKGWLNVKGFENWKALSNSIVKNYEESGVDYEDPYIKAKADIIADFVGDVLFGEVVDAKGNPIKLDTNFLVELKKKDRNLFQRFVEWVHSILKRLTTKGVVNKDIVKLEQKFKRLVEQSRQQRAKDDYDVGSYSLPDLDTEYMKAVESGDMETVQRMVDEAAKKAGYTINAYHGTPDSRNLVYNKITGSIDVKGDFSIFDSSKSRADRVDGSAFFFTNNEKVAKFYSPEQGYKPKVYNSKLKIVNPLFVECNGANWNEIPFDKLAYSYPTPNGGVKTTNKVTTKDIAQYARENGYDGVVFENIIDGKADTSENIGTVYAVFSSNQIKSADPVTYDDKGKVIPLSQRFNPENDDIRYSLPDLDSSGHKLSAGQMEYFKDSKVRDEKGRLIPVYHGSKSAGFTEFTKSDEIGYFFARTIKTSKTYAGGSKAIYAPDKNSPEFSGAANYKVYLDIKKPYIIDGNGANWNQLEANGERVDISIKSQKWNNGSGIAKIQFKYNSKTYSQTVRTSEEFESFISKHTNPEMAKAFAYAMGQAVDKNGKGEFNAGFIWDFKNSVQGDTKNTRDIVRKAYNSHWNYDGVIFKNVVDSGDGSKIKADDLYVVFDSNQIKSVNNTNPTEDKDIRYSLPDDGYAPTFYSKMGKTVDEMKQDKIGANSVISYLKGRGVKDEEIKWSGIETFLEGKKSVTKQELLDFINASSLEIGEQIGTENANNDVRDAINSLYYTVEREFPYCLDFSSTSEFIEGIAYELERDRRDLTSVYDEIEAYILDAMFTHFEPTDEYSEFYEWQDSEDGQKIYAAIDDTVNTIGVYAGVIQNTSGSRQSRWQDYTLADGKNYREIVFTMPGSTYSNHAMETHWGKDAKGILAHARIQDFYVNGKKMLFIEEIQSDWHNEGHKQGYESEKRKREIRHETHPTSDEKIVRLYENGEPTIHWRYEEQFAIEDEDWNVIGIKSDDEILASFPEERGLFEKIPDAPFKDNYHEYVLKRLLRMAAEEGYDSIGWTPAQIQSDRWSDEFAEGYRIEYDQDIPKFLKKYGKQWGATVGSTVLNNGTEVWSMDITDQMKNSVLYEGQALYSLPDIPDVAKGMESANVAEETSSIDLAPLPEDAMKTPTNRELISNALELIDTSTQAGQDEIKLLNKYLDTIDYIKENEAQLSEVQKKLFPKGGVNPDSISVSDVEKQIKSGKKEIHGYEIDHIHEGKHGVSYTLKTPYDKWGNDHRTGYDMDVYRAIAERIVEQYRKDAANFPHYAKTIARIINENKRYLMQLEEMKPIKDILARGKSNTKRRVLVDEGEITVDETLAEAINKYGTMPKGENPKVDVDVPNKVSDTKGVRRFARTALESGHLTEGMSEDAKREIINGALNYEISSNKMVTNIAEKKVAKDINKAIQEWEGLMASGKIPTAEDIALGEVLLVEAAKAGNANDVAMYLAEIAALGTQLGQGIQALSLLKKLTGVGQLHYVSRVIAQMNEDLKRRYGDKFQDVLSVDPNLEEILAKSKNQAEIEEVIDDILTDVAKQMPSTWLDKFNAWRYLAMLGNTRTHIRNFLGNAIFLPAIRIKDALGTIGERMFIKDVSHRTKVFKVNKKYREYAMKDFEEVKGLLTRGGKMNPSDIVQDRRKIFTSKLFAPVEKFRKFNFDMLEKEDLIFLKKHYIHALGSVLQSRGLDVNNITEQQLKDARDYAINEAKKATYRDFSFFANMLNKLAHPTKNGKPVRDVATKGLAVLVEGALPFKKTPINILKRGIEYSPLGIATTFGNAIIAGRRGEFSGAEFIDGITSGMTGTMILGLGMLLQSMGWLVGGLGYDDEDALERLSGAQPYAIDFGDWSYTIDWMAPSSLPLLIGAEISKALDKEEGHISDLLLAIAEPMTELSFLQGVNDIIEGVAYSGENGLGVTGEVVTNLASTYVSQYFPTLTGQVARTFDDTRRANFVDKSSAVPKTLQKTAQKILGKIPFAENQKIPYIDAWGRTEENGNVLLRVFENFVSPGYVSKIEDDKVNNELAKVYTNTGESGVIPKKAGTSFSVNGKMVYLDAEKYVQYATDKGQYSRKYLEEIMSSDLYNGLSSDGKAEAIAFLFSYANAKAKSNVSDYDYREISTYKTAAKLEDAGISPASYAVAKFAMSKENADTDGSDSVSKSEKRKALRNAGFSSRDANKILNINKK